MSRQDFAWPQLTSDLRPEDQAAAVLEAARKEGFDAGYAAGLAEARTDNQCLQEALRDSANQFDAFVSGSQTTLSEQFCELASSVLGALVDTELSLRPEVLEGLIERALSTLDRVHPRPRVRVSEAAVAWLPESWQQRADIEIDAALADGAVRIDGGETQFEFDPYAEIQSLIDLAQEAGGTSGEGG